MNKFLIKIDDVYSPHCSTQWINANSIVHIDSTHCGEPALVISLSTGKAVIIKDAVGIEKMKSHLEAFSRLNVD